MSSAGNFCHRGGLDSAYPLLNNEVARVRFPESAFDRIMVAHGSSVVSSGFSGFRHLLKPQNDNNRALENASVISIKRSVIRLK